MIDMERKAIAYIRTDGIFNDSRATKEISLLLEKGYYILLIGWDRSYSALEKCQQVFGMNAFIKYEFFNCSINHIGIKNFDKLIKWFGFVKKCLKKNAKDIDAVHACNLDAGIPALSFCKQYNIPLVYDIYDYYIDAHRIPNVLVGTIEKKEIDVINFSKLCIICTEERKKQISKATPQNIVVIHNSPSVGRAIYEEDTPVLYDYFYCGVLGGGRLIHEILNLNDGRFRMGFAGYGDHIQTIQKANDKFGNIDYLGEIPYRKCLEYEKKSLCLSAIYEPTYRNHKLCAPNKFYEALALGKPVIVCRGTGIDKIVEKYDIGIVIDYDANQFYDAVEYLKNNHEYCLDVKKRGRKLYDDCYSWEIMSSRLSAAYEEIVFSNQERKSK